MENYFGKNGFIWFIGVVEDRMDPEKLGRVRVRCIGHHTEDKTDIPTKDLSWSTVMSPTSSPSMDGMGTTPPFLVEGSWVTGFFIDQFKQESIIVGSLPGFNTKKDLATRGSLGFSDPTGIYPKTGMDYDTNKLARDGAENKIHASYISRNSKRIWSGNKDEPGDIQIATKPNNKSVDPTSSNDTRMKWCEPEPKSGLSTRYPFNHIQESESGHIREIDDTPGSETILNYHRSGSFDEIFPDGSKTTKIVGSEYEITLQDKNVYIKGKCNITIDGDCRQLVKGDYVLEVFGDYTEKIHKSKHSKIGARGSDAGGGNYTYEIDGNRSGHISNTDNLTIDSNYSRICKGNHTDKINGSYDTTVIEDYNTIIMGSTLFSSKGNITMTSYEENVNIYATKDLNLDAHVDVNINADGHMYGTATTINLN